MAPAVAPNIPRPIRKGSEPAVGLLVPRTEQVRFAQRTLDRSHQSRARHGKLPARVLPYMDATHS